MPKPCMNRNNNKGWSPVIVIGTLSVIKISEVLDCGFITTFILIIAGALLFTVLWRYLKK
ncbi:MAG: hypothetical protein K2J08_11250 [Ruminococcus sp.]|nr:hypothetical protein [Ruminococcus sp.]